MLNLLWAGMLLTGIVYGAFAGTLSEITDGCLVGAKDAVALCIAMAGAVAFWNGIMMIAKETGLVSLAAKRIRPFLVWLMPGLKGNEQTLESIAVNITANILGLGWAATPAGLKAMEELSVAKRGVVSDEMCIFLILNISSLQLIPINVIAYRSQYGSMDPAAIVGPGIVATAISTIVAIIFCKSMTGHSQR